MARVKALIHAVIDIVAGAAAAIFGSLRWFRAKDYAWVGLCCFAGGVGAIAIGVWRLCDLAGPFGR